jgi:hypothetical protein
MIFFWGVFQSLEFRGGGGGIFHQVARNTKGWYLKTRLQINQIWLNLLKDNPHFFCMDNHTLATPYIVFIYRVQLGHMVLVYMRGVGEVFPMLNKYMGLVFIYECCGCIWFLIYMSNKCKCIWKYRHWTSVSA